MANEKHSISSKEFNAFVKGTPLSVYITENGKIEKLTKPTYLETFNRRLFLHSSMCDLKRRNRNINELSDIDKKYPKIEKGFDFKGLGMDRGQSENNNITAQANNHGFEIRFDGSTHIKSIYTSLKAYLKPVHYYMYFSYTSDDNIETKSILLSHKKRFESLIITRASEDAKDSYAKKIYELLDANEYSKDYSPIIEKSKVTPTETRISNRIRTILAIFSTMWGSDGSFDYIKLITELMPNAHFRMKFVEILNKGQLPEAPKQVFKDSLNRMCVFNPMINFYDTEISKDNLTMNRKKTLKTFHNKLVKTANDYPDGVPEEDIQSICNRIGVNIKYKDPFNQSNKIYNCDKKAFKTFEYINAFNDHLEETKQVLNTNAVILTDEEFEKFREECIEGLKDKQYFTYGGSYTNMTFISKHGIMYKKQRKDTYLDKFNEYKMWYDEENLYERGAVYSSHIKINDIPENMELKEGDLSRAYTNFKMCDQYMGFPSLLQPVTIVDNTWDYEKFIGYYQVEVLSVDREFERFGLRKDEDVILTSPELIYLRDHANFKFNLRYGQFSLTKFDFEFPDDIIKSKEYCILTGKMGSINNTSSISMITDYDMTCRLSRLENARWHQINNGHHVITIETPKRTKTLRHIGGFITSYLRCRMYKYIKQTGFDNVFVYKVDSLVVKKDSFLHEDLKLKDVNVNFYYDDTQFYQLPLIIKPWDLRKYYTSRLQCLIGPGGSGKTYTILNHFENCIYVASTWNLVVDKMNEFNVRGKTQHRLSGDSMNPSKFLLQFDPSYPVILIDEATQLLESSLEKIVNNYPHSLIFLAGDIGYQTSNQPNQIIKVPDGWSTIEFTTNRRTNDKQLLEVLDVLRTNIDNSLYSHSYCMDKFPHISIDELHKVYDEDYILVTTNADNTIYKDLKTNRYMYTSLDSLANRFMSNDKKQYPINGDIEYFTDKPCSKWIKKHTFTINSFQGSTIKAPKKLYIHCSFEFNTKLLYTAISRVQCFDQIVMIDTPCRHKLNITDYDECPFIEDDGDAYDDDVNVAVNDVIDECPFIEDY